MKELKKVANEYEVNIIEYDEPLLDYVSVLAEKYKPVTKQDFENGYYFSTAKGDFAWRYLQNEIDKSRLNKYLKDKDVQDTLKAFGYDIEKFWYLLLFVNDYSYGACLNGIKINDSPVKQIRKLIDGIIENSDSFNGTELSFKTPVKIVLERKGKHKITVDNPIAISWLTKICIQQLEKIENGSLMTTSITQGTGKIEHDSVSDSQHIWYFSKMLLDFFELEKPQDKEDLTNGGIISTNKMLFISRLVYLMRISKNNEYTKSENKLNGIKYHYKDVDLDMVNGIYL